MNGADDVFWGLTNLVSMVKDLAVACGGYDKWQRGTNLTLHDTVQFAGVEYTYEFCPAVLAASAQIRENLCQAYAGRIELLLTEMAEKIVNIQTKMSLAQLKAAQGTQPEVIDVSADTNEAGGRVTSV